MGTPITVASMIRRKGIPVATPNQMNPGKKKRKSSGTCEEIDILSNPRSTKKTWYFYQLTVDRLVFWHVCDIFHLGCDIHHLLAHYVVKCPVSSVLWKASLLGLVPLKTHISHSWSNTAFCMFLEVIWFCQRLPQRMLLGRRSSLCWGNNKYFASLHSLGSFSKRLHGHKTYMLLRDAPPLFCEGPQSIFIYSWSPFLEEFHFLFPKHSVWKWLTDQTVRVRKECWFICFPSCGLFQNRGVASVS